MRTYVLDSSALLRYLDDGPGAERVESILVDCAGGRAELRISAIQWGEIAGKLRQRLGAEPAREALGSILPAEARISPANAAAAVRAAALKVDRKLAYADAFAVELAQSTPEAVLVTADYGFKAVEDLIQIEFLPAK
jgi:predicted nucleic acid-binding protein